MEEYFQSWSNLGAGAIHGEFPLRQKSSLNYQFFKYGYLLSCNWYDVMKENTTAADAILDRLVYTSVHFELKGASMRQKSNIKSTETHRND